MKKILLFILITPLFLGFIPLSYNICRNDQLKEYYYNFDKHVQNQNEVYREQSARLFNDFEFDSLTIPVKLAGNLILAETYIDGQYGNLIFDSGSASELVLNRTWFRNHKKRGSKTVSGVNGSIQNIEMIEVDSMIFAGYTIREKQADLIDLSRVENRVQTKILGFFGLQMLNNYEFVIDVKNNQLKLFPLDRKGRRTSGNYMQEYDYTQEIEIIKDVIFIWAEIAGKELRFCFDTAAERNMLSHSVSKKIIQTVNITGRARLTGAGRHQSEVLTGEMSDFRLGDNILEDMETLIADVSSLNTIYDTHIAGVLGYDFLKSGMICINMKKQQLKINFYKK